MNLKVEDGGMELPMLLDDDKNEVCDDIARKEALLARGRRKKTEKKLSKTKARVKSQNSQVDLQALCKKTANQSALVASSSQTCAIYPLIYYELGCPRGSLRRRLGSKA